MSRTSVGLVGARLTIKTGSEGPHYDPYSFTEFKHTRHTDKREVLLHMGLGEYIRVNGKEVIENGPLCTEEEKFKELTGFYSWQWEFFINRLRKKCRKCGCKRSRWMSGYPGETFRICAKCEEVLSVDFDESAII
jgi:hypothetical protein